MPDSLLKEVDDLILLEKINRSEFTRQAIKFYIKEKINIKIREQLKKGYLEMAGINLAFAEENLMDDEEQFQAYEKILKE